MRISEFTEYLQNINNLEFSLPNGEKVPAHFHITEAGLVTKHFIDCGGTVRTEKNVSFQLWTANDYDHRIEPQKVLGIIKIADSVLGNEDLEVEIEYQSDTIGKYGVAFVNEGFVLTSKFTNCLAPDRCGIPEEKPKIRLSNIQLKETSCCTPGSGCC
ncbi:MAG: DUF6428 family protein [Spirosomaceae bacterium]|jgi:hypothetical protein|nr:DUF6428 family protein [Spirosomataceae bacterium]